jgi:HNH endonuclease
MEIATRKQQYIDALLNYRAVLRASIAGEKCTYCTDPATTWDHVIPVSKGGPDVPANLTPVCVRCNTSKGAMYLADWVAQQEVRVLAARRLIHDNPELGRATSLEDAVKVLDDLDLATQLTIEATWHAVKDSGNPLHLTRRKVRDAHLARKLRAMERTERGE